MLTEDSGVGVQRFSTKYVALEDRMLLLVEEKSRYVNALWLTRRMLNNLILPLLKTLNTLPSVQAVPSGQALIVQKFSQLDAVSGIKKQPPISVDFAGPQESNESLVTAVDVHKKRRKVVLVFRAEPNIEQALPLTEKGLRQWLSVLQNQYQAAGWAETFWPSWMGQQGERAGLPGVHLN